MIEVFTPDAAAAATQVGRLWQLALSLCAVAFALAAAGAGLALLRDPEGGPCATRAVRAAAFVTGAVVLLMAGGTLATERALARLPADEPLAVELTAHLWWWELRYDRGDAAFAGANELHLPAGRAVRLTLRSADVVHALRLPGPDLRWDFVPGRATTTTLRIDAPGRYAGTCAEVCGGGHAAMGLDVVVLRPDRFEAWAARQRAAPSAPADPSAQRGREVFARAGCEACHSLGRGAARRARGPDLGHLAGRAGLGAGVRDNTPEALHAFLRDPQRVKPGVDMPATRLSDAQRRDLVAFLAGLR